MKIRYNIIQKYCLNNVNAATSTSNVKTSNDNTESNWIEKHGEQL